MNSVMESFSDISTIIAAVSVVITIVLHFSAKRSAKRVETYNALSVIYDAYYDLEGKDINDNYKEYVRFLSRIDRFSNAALSNLYDRKIIKDRAGDFFREQYQSFMKDLMIQRRNQFGRTNYYENIDKLINQL